MKYCLRLSPQENNTRAAKKFLVIFTPLMLLPYFNKDLVEAGCDEAGRGCLAGPVVAAAGRSGPAGWIHTGAGWHVAEWLRACDRAHLQNLLTC